jgi:serine protease DegS
VTSGADQIVVALKDGRETLARVIGSDPETDLAVLKIDLKNLPSITVGRSDNIRIGDVALAIGNPFGVGQTVTMGIISATGRNQLGLNNYEDFIQTDAAINPGNSGGALVDAIGNLTGINTAIFSKSGGSQGIGFAIPVKLAMEVMKSIIEHGQVIRGWLGIEVQPLTQELAESFGLSGRPGIVVAGIFRDGPAQKAGLQLGDVILAIDGEPAGDGRRSMNQVARIKPTDKVAIEVMRNGKELKLTAEVGLRPPPAPVKDKEEE